MISILKYSDLKFGRVAVNNEKIISREIIKEKNENISQDRENISQDKENISREIKDSSISDDQVELRVNNSLALASKNVLEEFKSKWNSLDDYIDDRHRTGDEPVPKAGGAGGEPCQKRQKHKELYR